MLGRFTRQVGSGQRTQNPTRQWLSGFIVLVSYLGLLQKQRHWFCISIESRDHTLSSKVVEYFKFWFGFCLWWCSFFFFFPRASLWYILSFFFFFWLHNATCGILVSQPGIEPVPPLQWKYRVLTTGSPLWLSLVLEGFHATDYHSEKRTIGGVWRMD